MGTLLNLEFKRADAKRVNIWRHLFATFQFVLLIIGNIPFNESSEDKIFSIRGK